MGIGARLRGWWGERLRHKLLASSLATVLLFLTLLGYLSLRVGQAAVLHVVNQRNLQVARLVAQDINTHFDNIWGNVRLVVHQLEASNRALSLQALTMLELRRASPLTYRALYLLDGEGNVLLHLEDNIEDLLAIQDEEEIVTRPPLLLSDRMSAAYIEAREGKLHLSPTYIVGVDQVPVIIMSIPLGTREGGQRQVVIAEIDLRDIWRRMDEIRVGQTGRAFVVSKDDIIIAHPSRSYVGQPVASELGQVIAGYEGQAQYTDPLSDRAMLAAYSPVGGQSGWGIVVEQEYAEALAPINAIALVTLGVLLVALGLATLITILTARSVTRPIQHLAEATQTIARTGDLSRDIAVEGQDEVGQLAVTFNQMIRGLRDAQERLLATQAIAHELRIAQQIQASLLPEPDTSIPGLQVTARCLPAREVGGDFYDYLQLMPNSQNPAGGFAIAVGDVSGKGIPASLYMAVTSSALAAKAPFVPHVAQLYQELNAMLYPRMATNRMNAALLYVHFTGQNPGCVAHVVNAGLIAPLLRRAERCEYLDINGLPLGAIPSPGYQETELRLKPGDWLVLCSDGIIEAMNAEGRMYGFDRLCQQVSIFQDGGSREMADWIMADVQAFLDGAEPHDDITIVVVRFTEEA